jgi:hypothetical protein
MDATQKIVLLLSIILYIIGGVSSAFLQLETTPFSLKIHPAFDYVLLSAGAFVFGMLLFSYLAPLFFLYVGFISGKIIATNTPAYSLLLIPMLLALVAGSKAGIELKKDLDEKSNFYDSAVKITIVLAIALFFAAIIGIAIPFLPDNNTILNALEITA